MAIYKIEYEIDSTRRANAMAAGEVIDYPDGDYMSGYVLPTHATPGTGKITRLPDPPIKQRFTVEVESPSADGPTSADAVKRYLEGTRCYGASRRVTVTPE